jgi:RES domain-containing protein
VISFDALKGVLPGLPRIHVQGVFWRTVRNDLLKGPPPGAPPGSRPQPLWPGGAALKGARYTPIGSHNALYMAPDGATALSEVQAVVFGPGGQPHSGPIHDPLVIFANEADLPAVVDLCDRNVQRALSTRAEELVGPWVRAQDRHLNGRGPLPATQALGQAAFECGTILALQYPSYRRPGARNLVVFTDHLASLGGRISVHDVTGTLLQSLP